jgi:formimidoylglutamate deiminase
VGDEIIDSWIFSGNANAVQDVYVGGKQLISKGRHAQQESINKAFCETLKELRA